MIFAYPQLHFASNMPDVLIECLAKVRYLLRGS